MLKMRCVNADLETLTSEILFIVNFEIIGTL